MGNIQKPVEEKRRKGIFWDPYWRCKVISCARCHIKRPLSQFYKDRGRARGYIYRCIKCEKEARAPYIKSRLEHFKEYKKSWLASKPGYARQCMQRYRERNKEQLRHNEKMARTRRAERYGISDDVRLYRTPSGRLRRLSIQLKRKYGLSYSAAQVREKWGQTGKYITLFRAWKKSGFALKYAPVLYSDKPKPKTLEDFRLTVYGEIRSINIKKLFKKGVFKHVKREQDKKGQFTGGSNINPLTNGE